MKALSSPALEPIAARHIHVPSGTPPTRSAASAKAPSFHDDHFCGPATASEQHARRGSKVAVSIMHSDSPSAFGMERWPLGTSLETSETASKPEVVHMARESRSRKSGLAPPGNM